MRTWLFVICWKFKVCWTLNCVQTNHLRTSGSADYLAFPKYLINEFQIYANWCEINFGRISVKVEVGCRCFLPFIFLVIQAWDLFVQYIADCFAYSAITNGHRERFFVFFSKMALYFCVLSLIVFLRTFTYMYRVEGVLPSILKVKMCLCNIHNQCNSKQ